MNQSPPWREWLIGNKDSEAGLVKAAQRGDQNAYNTLIRHHETLLLCFLVRRVGSNAAEDVRQETLLAAWTGLPKFGRKVRFKTWLLGIAVHKCADHFRHAERQGVHLPLEIVENISAEVEADTSSAVSEAVQDLLTKLPSDQREVLALYYESELTLAEVAQVLERNPNTVKAQFYRAHKQIKQQLPQEMVTQNSMQSSVR
ncbi:MAG: RNA polymerase sigma factor [Chthonomonadaceae bacterium]|nr:RNA polymerase sigma factor [Chthonomonadaceae bacterium]